MSHTLLARLFTLTLLGLLGLFFTSAAAATGITKDKPRVAHQVSSQVCRACHEDIYEQWSGSMHANSVALKDPIHGGFYQMVIGDPTKEGVKTKKGKYPVCLKCHSPNAARDKKTKLDARPAYSEGVNCLSCHMMESYKGTESPEGKAQYGTDAYVMSKTALQAPSGQTYSVHTAPSDGSDDRSPVELPFHPFPMVGNAMHKSNEACMGCHDRRDNFKGAPLCVTGDEYNMVGSFVSCQSCHMPRIDGIANHTMGGGHDEGMVKEASIMNMETEVQGDQIKAKVEVHNRLPHAFPTGAPFRYLFLRVVAYDSDGNELWKNFQKDPIKEDPKSLFIKVLGDKDDKPTGPPTATQVLQDTRLQPNERREVEYTIPARNVYLVRAELMYNLIKPVHIEMLGDALTPEHTDPKVAAMAESFFGE
ncbi:MAG: cytochrome c family protein [Pseudomonadota bacterium]|nr:cytochrome c family protein [Pseudomonadota bacterium]